MGFIRVVVTGNVDDGKSTLMGRLFHDADALLDEEKSRVRDDFAHLTDGLKAEREEGKTHDVAYRHLIRKGKRYLFADAPGHPELIGNFFTAASTADAAIVLIDATKGLTPQSQRHLYLTSRLGTKELLVVINKIDLLKDKKAVAETKKQVRAFIDNLAFENVSFVPASATRGEGVDAVLKWIDALSVLSKKHQEARFLFQGSAHAHRLQGVIKKNQSLFVYPYGDACTLSTDGRVETDIQLSYGDVIAPASETLQKRKTIKVEVVLVGKRTVQEMNTYLVQGLCGTKLGKIDRIHGRLDLSSMDWHEDPVWLAPTDIGRLTINLDGGLLVDAYEVSRDLGGFLLIDPETHESVGVGMIDSYETS